MSACPCWHPTNGVQCHTCGEVQEEGPKPLNVHLSVKEYHRFDVAEALRNGGYAEYAEQIESPSQSAQAADDGGAAELRYAAATLRRLAQSATGGTWVRNRGNGIHTRLGACIATTEMASKDARRADADYIATMRPSLGLVLAELIQREHDEHATDDMSDTGDGPLCGTWPVLLDVARLINGTTDAE